MEQLDGPACPFVEEDKIRRGAAANSVTFRGRKIWQLPISMSRAAAAGRAHDGRNPAYRSRPRTNLTRGSGRLLNNDGKRRQRDRRRLGEGVVCDEAAAARLT